MKESAEKGADLQEILKRLYGGAVTEESLVKFHEELGKRFVSKADFNQRGEELKVLREQAAQQEAELAGCRAAKQEIEHLQRELQEAEQKHAEEMAAYCEQTSKKQLEAAMERALTEAGARNLTAVKALLDTERITIENGALKGLDEQLWEIKEENGYLFTTADKDFQFIRPTAQSKAEITGEDFQKMGYMERLKLKREQPELYRSMIQTNRR